VLTPPGERSRLANLPPEPSGLANLPLKALGVLTPPGERSRLANLPAEASRVATPSGLANLIQQGLRGSKASKGATLPQGWPTFLSKPQGDLKPLVRAPGWPTFLNKASEGAALIGDGSPVSTSIAPLNRHQGSTPADSQQQQTCRLAEAG